MAGNREKTAGEAAKQKADKKAEVDAETGDREQTAAEAAKAKVERREQQEAAEEQARQEAEEAKKAAKKEDPRTESEKAQDLEAGTIETSNLKETGPDAGKSSEELREEVEAAREALAATVTELGEKVDPRPNVEAAAATARSNAVPLAVGAGLLLALLIWIRRR